MALVLNSGNNVGNVSPIDVGRKLLRLKLTAEAGWFLTVRVQSGFVAPHCHYTKFIFAHVSELVDTWIVRDVEANYMIKSLS